MIDFNEYAKKIHEVAVENGWYDPLPPTDAQFICLFHEEIQEAFSAWRVGGEVSGWRIEYTGKPEGVPVELIDLWIRLADYFAYKNKGDRDFNQSAMEESVASCAVKIEYNGDEFPDFISKLHFDIARSYNRHRKIIDNTTPLFDVMDYIMAFCQINDIPFQYILDKKIEYNRTRPYRHGGKRC